MKKKMAACLLAGLMLLGAAALADGVKKNRADTQKRLNELLDAWERELEKERSRIDEEAAHGAGEAEESDK
jgi:hypothetical protein